MTTKPNKTKTNNMIATKTTQIFQQNKITKEETPTQYVSRWLDRNSDLHEDIYHFINSNETYEKITKAKLAVYLFKLSVINICDPLGDEHLNDLACMTLRQADWLTIAANYLK